MSARSFSNEDTAPRLLAYLASVRPLRGCDDESYDRGRGLIMRMAMSVSGEDLPSLRMSAQQVADVVHFIRDSEPIKSQGWWSESGNGPSHLAGFVFVLDALERNLRSWAGRPSRHAEDSAQIATHRCT
jgi:hypothetical protein